MDINSSYSSNNNNNDNTDYDNDQPSYSVKIITVPPSKINQNNV